MGRSRHEEGVPPGGRRDHPDAEPDLDARRVSEDPPTVRPTTFASYVGQGDVVGNVAVSVRASRKRGDALDHFLFVGPPGLGKTTLAGVVAAEMGVSLRVTSGPVVDHKGVLASLLTSLEDRDILFIDEIHRLPPIVEEILYPAMEDRRMDMAIGDGAHAQVIRMELPAFTLLGATTRPDLVGQPLRDRFGHVFTMDFYSTWDLATIVAGTASRSGIVLSDAAALAISVRSRGTPRIANRLLRRVRDFADANDQAITTSIVIAALTLLKIDQLGLDRLDRRYLETLRVRGRGQPMGVEALAAAMGESRDTIAGVVEPFLVMRNLVRRTARGRQLTEAGNDHLVGFA